MGSKKTTTKSQETATQTPDVPAWARGPIQNYYGEIANVGNGDSDFWTAPNASQTAAFNLPLTPGSGATGNASNALTGMLGKSAPQIYGNGSQQILGRIGDNGVTGAFGENITPATYTPATATSATQTLATTPDRDMLGAEYGDAITVNRPDATGFQPVLSDFRPSAGGSRVEEAYIRDYIDDFLNPATDQVVNTSLADYDVDADRRQAAFERQGAANNAFGGSGFALREGQLGAELARGRGALSAGLRRDAFNDAVSAAAQQAGLLNQSRIAQANNRTQASIANNGLLGQIALANQNAANTFARDRYQGDLTASLADAGYASDARNRQFEADLGDNRLAYNTEADTNRFNAGTANDLSMFNAGQETGVSQFNSGLGADMSQFNTNLAFDQAATNAGLEMQNRGLNLSTAQSLGDLGLAQNADARANVESLLSRGSEQERLDMAQQLAPYTRLGVMGDLLDPGLLSIITGQTVNTEGTSTSKESGGLLGQILGGAFQLGSAYLGK